MKKIVILVMVLTLILTACGGSQPAAPSESSSESSSEWQMTQEQLDQINSGPVEHHSDPSIMIPDEFEAIQQEREVPEEDRLLTREESWELLNEFFANDPNVTDLPTFKAIGEEDVFVFFVMFIGDAQNEEINFIVNREDGSTWVENIATKERISLEDWAAVAGAMQNPWSEGDVAMGGPPPEAGSAQPIVATDLLGTWGWLNDSIELGTEDVMMKYTLTFFSNGTCEGAAALSYLTDSNKYLNGVLPNDVLICQTWEFLEYEQVLQVSGFREEFKGGGGFEKRWINMNVNFEVKRIDDLLWLINTADATSEKVQYIRE